MTTKSGNPCCIVATARNDVDAPASIVPLSPPPRPSASAGSNTRSTSTAGVCDVFTSVNESRVLRSTRQVTIGAGRGARGRRHAMKATPAPKAATTKNRYSIVPPNGALLADRTVVRSVISGGDRGFVGAQSSGSHSDTGEVQP